MEGGSRTSTSMLFKRLALDNWRIGISLLVPSTVESHSVIDHIHIALIISFPLEFQPLLWLASVRPTTLLLLISAHACSQRDIYPWGSREAKALCYLDQIELVDVEDGSQ
jgi:hypothetical protein